MKKGFLAQPSTRAHRAEPPTATRHGYGGDVGRQGGLKGDAKAGQVSQMRQILGGLTLHVKHGNGLFCF